MPFHYRQPRLGLFDYYYNMYILRPTLIWKLVRRQISRSVSQYSVHIYPTRGTPLDYSLSWLGILFFNSEYVVVIMVGLIA